MAIIDTLPDPDEARDLVEQDVAQLISTETSLSSTLSGIIESLAIYQEGRRRKYFNTRKMLFGSSEGTLQSVCRLFRDAIKSLCPEWTVEKAIKKPYFTISFPGCSRHSDNTLDWASVVTAGGVVDLNVNNAGAHIMAQKLKILVEQIQNLLIHNHLAVDGCGPDRFKVYLCPVDYNRYRRAADRPPPDLTKIQAYKIFLNLEQIMSLRQELMTRFEKTKGLRQTCAEIDTAETYDHTEAVIDNARERARTIQEALNAGVDIEPGQLFMTDVYGQTTDTQTIHLNITQLEPVDLPRELPEAEGIELPDDPEDEPVVQAINWNDVFNNRIPREERLQRARERLNNLARG